MAFTDTLRVAVKLIGYPYKSLCAESGVVRQTLYNMFRSSPRKPRKTTANLVLNAVVGELDVSEHKLMLKVEELRRVRTMLVKSYEEEYGSHD